MLRNSAELAVIVLLTVFKCFEFHLEMTTEACCNKNSTEQKRSIIYTNSMNASEVNRMKYVYAENVRGKRLRYERRRLNRGPKMDFTQNALFQYAPVFKTGSNKMSQQRIYKTQSIIKFNKKRIPTERDKTLNMITSIPLRRQLTSVDDVDNMIEKKLFRKYISSIDFLERKFYSDTFAKLSANCPPERRENGISFVQSGLFLHMALTAFTSTVNQTTRSEIESVSCYSVSEEEKTKVLKYVMTNEIPQSNVDLKFRNSFRLILVSGLNVTNNFQEGTAKELKLQIDYFNKTDDPASLVKILNQMVEIDSGGALRDTFDEDDISQHTCSVFVSTLYIRGRWRSSPTVLNGVWPFYDNTDGHRTTRMLRINDIVKYADLNAWDAQAVEISYATPDLSLLLVVPRGRSLRALSEKFGRLGVSHVIDQMTTKRIRVTLPLYTLRMTLLLPNKLRQMGINALVGREDISEEGNSTQDCGTFHLSQAVQRIMFWAEAGRNAYKDDGIEWDEIPEMDLIVDRPYIFFVRWRNLTLMNGHFVL